MDKNEAIEIFKKRISELSRFEGVDISQIQDSVLKARASVAINTLNLNKRLLMIFMDAPTKRLS
jgi:hypothetical protein